MKKLVVSMVLLFLTACGGGGGSSAGPSSGGGDPIEPASLLERIDLGTVDTRIPLGTALALTATGIYSDQSCQDVGDAVTWEIENPNILSWDTDQEGGPMRALAQGQSWVRVMLDGIEARVLLTVTDAVLDQVVVRPTQTRLPSGMETVVEATGFFSDQTSRDITDDITWNISNPDIVAVSGRRILAKAVGTTDIDAALGDRHHTVSVTVTDAILTRLELSPVNPVMAAGVSAVVQATGIFSDSSKKDISALVDWQSSDPTVADVATVNGRVRVSGFQPGVVSISAQRGGVTASSLLTVTEARLIRIDISPDETTMAKGQVRTFRATGIYTDHSSRDLTQNVLWETDDETLARVSNAEDAKGAVTALAMGSVSLGATLGDVSAWTRVTVGEALIETLYVSADVGALPAGLSRPLQAMGRYSDDSVQDLTQMVAWITSDSQVAVVGNGDEKGILTGIAAGEVTVFAHLDGIEGQMAIRISEALLTAMTIDPDTAILPAGQTLELTATGAYTDDARVVITQDVLWESSDSSVARVDNAQGTSGVIHALQPGQVEITGVLDGVSQSLTVIVTAATLDLMEIFPGGETMPSGLAQPYQALGYFSDGSVQDLTGQVLWQVSDISRASISNVVGLKGLLYAFAPGTLTITATLGDTQASTALTITGETLTAVRFSPPFVVVDVSSSMALALEGVFSDGSVRDLSAQALWISLNPQIASVSNTPGEEGTVTGIAAGQAHVLAVLGQVGVVTAVQVLKPVNRIEIAAISELIPLNWTLGYTATAVYQDGSSEDVTNRVLWTSSDREVADFYDFGRVIGLSEGLTEVAVSINGAVKDTVALEVIAFQELSLSYGLLGSGVIQFRVHGLFGGDRAMELTEIVTWQSDNLEVLTISNEAGEKGLAQVHQAGASEVTAVYDDSLSVVQEVVIDP